MSINILIFLGDKTKWVPWEREHEKVMVECWELLGEAFGLRNMF